MYLFALPKDYDKRLQIAFKGEHLTVYALSLTDLLILKCFAGREKDIPHARVLVRKGADTTFARKHILALQDKSIPKADAAATFLDDLEEELEEP